MSRIDQFRRIGRKLVAPMNSRNANAYFSLPPDYVRPSDDASDCGGKKAGAELTTSENYLPEHARFRGHDTPQGSPPNRRNSPPRRYSNQRNRLSPAQT